MKTRWEKTPLCRIVATTGFLPVVYSNAKQTCLHFQCRQQEQEHQFHLIKRKHVVFAIKQRLRLRKPLRSVFSIAVLSARVFSIGKRKSI